MLSGYRGGPAFRVDLLASIIEILSNQVAVSILCILFVVTTALAQNLRYRLTALQKNYLTVLSLRKIIIMAPGTLKKMLAFNL